MTLRISSLPLRARLDRGQWNAVVDWLAVGFAVSLPWSTSATGILVALWILAAVPTLDMSARRDISEPAAYFPVLLWLLAAIGMLWADVSFADRLGGLSKFHRLLVIPLLLIHFRRSERGIWVIYGFLAASVALLLASWGLAEIPGLPWRGINNVGVPTKDYIFQAMNFLICAFALLGYVCDAARAQCWRSALIALAVALLFLGNIFFVVTSRTALLVLPVLLFWLAWREFRWRGLIIALLLGVVAAAGTWFESPYLHDRLTKSVEEF